MDDLRGHVDVVGPELIQGWAVRASDPLRPPLVAFVQDGTVRGSVAPSRSYPELIEVIGLAGSMPAETPAVWRLPAPLSFGLRPDEPFDVVFAETGLPLGLGGGRVVPRVSAALAEYAARCFAGGVILQPHAAPEGNALTVETALLNWPRDADRVAAEIDGAAVEAEWREDGLGDALRPEARWFLPGRTVVARLQLDPAALRARGRGAVIRFHPPHPPEDPHAAWQARLRAALAVPHQVLDPDAPTPGEAELVRIGGRGDRIAYWMGGATTLFQIDEITRRFTGRRLVDQPRILDWGAGCGRVLRHLRDSAAILGQPTPAQGWPRVTAADVDPLNLAWCERHLPGHAEYLRCDFRPPLPVPDATFDLVYGVSVMTHLTERSQLDWLEEIRRVLRPGGLAILTVNGEFGILRGWAEPLAQMADRFGFSDMSADPAIGAEHVRHYRATVQTRAHIEANWAPILGVLDVIPACNAFSQDYVVLRRPEKTRTLPWARKPSA